MCEGAPGAEGVAGFSDQAQCLCWKGLRNISAKRSSPNHLRVPV